MKNEIFWIAIVVWVVIAFLYCLILYYSHKIKILEIDLELKKAECLFYKNKTINSDKLFKQINENYKELDKIVKIQEYKKYETMHTRSFGILPQSESDICQD